MLSLRCADLGLAQVLLLMESEELTKACTSCLDSRIKPTPAVPVGQRASQ